MVESLHRSCKKMSRLFFFRAGDPAFEGAFSWFAQIYPDKLSANITFDVKLRSQKYTYVTSSCTSRLNRYCEVAMRYGTPLVHEVGGLRILFEPLIQSKEAVLALATTYLLTGWIGFKQHWLYRNHPDVWETLKKQTLWVWFLMGLQPGSHTLLTCTIV